MIAIVAPEVNKSSAEGLDSMTFWPCSRSQQNQSQKFRFDDFLALGPEIDKIIRRTLDLMIVWPWLQKPTSSLVNHIVI